MRSEYPRRQIITDDRDAEHVVRRGVDDVNPLGDIHESRTPADAAASARAQWDAVHDEIAGLEPLLGWERTDKLLSGLNAAIMAARCEAVDRAIQLARDMVDYEIGIFVAPAPAEEESD